MSIALPKEPWPREYHKVTVGRESFEVDVRYKNLKPIGDGSYGFVCSAEDSVEERQVAIKKIGEVFGDLVDAKRILREIKLLRHFDGHENIINITDIMCIPPGTTNFKDVYIVTNLMESDMDRIISSGQPLTDQHFQYFLYQVLRGLKYIHSANVLHRDMKPSNLLVNANCDLAICDFGLARGVELEYEDELTEYVVTRWYRAPELLCDSTHYGKTVDIWSVGCIFAEMLSRRPFFQGHNPHHQLETIVSVLGLPSEEELSFVTHPAARKVIMSRASTAPSALESYFPADVSPLAIDLLRRMLVFHPEHRITVDEALEHAYLADLHGQVHLLSLGCACCFLLGVNKMHIDGGFAICVCQHYFVPLPWFKNEQRPEKGATDEAMSPAAVTAAGLFFSQCVGCRYMLPVWQYACRLQQRPQQQYTFCPQKACTSLVVSTCTYCLDYYCTLF